MIKRSLFDMSHINSTTCKMGYYIPVMMQECLPGDTWQGNTSFFIRVAPMVAPLMHRVMITCCTVYFPLRLLWKDFETFITGGPDGLDDSVPPYVSVTPTQGSLADYLGLPLTENPIQVSALPFRACALAYNWLWRDQDLQDELPVSLESGEDTTTSLELQRGSWGKDYFTTARPWPQKGPQITIPLIGNTGIEADGNFVFNIGASSSTVDWPEGSIATPDSESTGFRNITIKRSSTASSTAHPLSYLSGLRIGDEDGEIGISINDLLESMAMQRMATRRSLFGSRYEDLLHYWGLRTQDFRLQEPELVSVGRGRLQFSEVLQTTPDASGAGVGSMAGHGVGATQSGRFRYYCHEHGYLMTFMIVRPQAVYTQGIERLWSRQTRWDFWNPEMQHIGQQQVLSKEVYADGTDADSEVFGYQNRFDEYRRGKNHVSGEFRTTQNYWNMARLFENRPSLNSEFITCNPTDRVFQLSDSLSDQLYCMINNDLRAKRLISRNGNPM